MFVGKCLYNYVHKYLKQETTTLPEIKEKLVCVLSSLFVFFLKKKRLTNELKMC